MRKQSFIVLGLLVAAIAAGCGANGEVQQPPPQATPTPEAPAPEPTPTPTPAEPSGNGEADLSSDISNFVLEDLTVAPGTTVTWTNRDSAPHTATAGAPGSPSGEFDSGNLARGESYSFTFEQAGEFAYFCIVHPNMTATVRVMDETAAATPAPAAPAMPDYEDDYY